jgi:hypothetical protein
MGSQISGLSAKICLQMYENPLVKNVSELYFTTDLLMCDHTRINPEYVNTKMNKVHVNVQLKLAEGNDALSY